MLKGSFLANLGRVYGLYTGAFLVFVLLMAVLEQMGVPADDIGLMFVGFTIVIYAAIGWLSRTMQVDAYYVAGREVPALYNGMATAADWMSGASFVAMAGGVYFGGYGYIAFIVGWTGGYVLVNSLMAPYLRKFGCYTVPDFIGTRYGGNVARLCAIVVLVVASFTYVTAPSPRGPCIFRSKPVSGSACSASCCAPCSAVCGRSPGRRSRSISC